LDWRKIADLEIMADSYVGQQKNGIIQISSH